MLAVAHITVTVFVPLNADLNLVLSRLNFGFPVLNSVLPIINSALPRLHLTLPVLNLASPILNLVLPILHLCQDFVLAFGGWIEPLKAQRLKLHGKHLLLAIPHVQHG